MILNAWAVTAIGAALLTGLLAAKIVWESFRLLREKGAFPPGPVDDERERKASLILLLSTVVFLLKLPTWPFFYAALYSYVSQVPGAMCVFGVTQVKPLLTLLMQIVKPLVFFFSGLWLIVQGLARDSDALPLPGKQPLLLAAAALLAAGDSVLDIVYYTTFSTAQEVACCTTIFDLPAVRAGQYAASVGVSSERLLLAAYYGLNILLILLLGRSSRRAAAATAFLTAVNSVTTVAAWYFALAPKLMNLPGHHCIYCMWQHAPSSVAMTGLFALGSAASGWAAVLGLAGARYAPAERAEARARSWRRIARISLLLALIPAAL